VEGALGGAFGVTKVSVAGRIVHPGKKKSQSRNWPWDEW
jgi:hypothetical protein